MQRLVFKVYDCDTFGAKGKFDNSASEGLDVAKQDVIGQAECDLASIMGAYGQRKTLTLTHGYVRTAQRRDFHRRPVIDRSNAHTRPPQPQPNRAAANRGTVLVRGEELPHQNATVRFKLAASELPAKKGPSNVFLVLERVQEAPGGVLSTPVYRTEVLPKTTCPRWKPFEVGVQQLCNANFAQLVGVKVYAWQKGGDHALLAQAETTLDALLASEQPQATKTLQLLGSPPAKTAAKGKATGKAGNRDAAAPAGVLVLKSAHLVARPSFLDCAGRLPDQLQCTYVRITTKERGLVTLSIRFDSIRFRSYKNFAITPSTPPQVAIDFTASNGEPSHPQSLHFIPPYATGGGGSSSATAPPLLYQAPNPYVQAILAVGQVLEHYDSDRTFPTFGFGAKVGHHTSHCFALNGDDARPEVVGIEGVLHAYQRAICTYPLAGPTYFQEIIARVAATAAHCTPREQNYQVLLIIVRAGLTCGWVVSRLLCGAWKFDMCVCF